MQGRFVSYIYKYGQNDAKEKNVGFLKVQRINRGNDRCRIQINVRDAERTGQSRCEVYLFGRQGDSCFLHLLGECMVCRGTGEMNLDTVWNRVTPAGYSMEEYDGGLLCCEDGSLYATQWRGENLQPHFLLQKHKEESRRDEGVHNGNAKTNPDENAEQKQTQQEQPQQEQPSGVDVSGETVRKSDTHDTSAQKSNAHDADIQKSDTQNINASNKIASGGSAEREKTQQEQPEKEQPRNTDCNPCRRLLDSRSRLDTVEDQRIVECVRIEPQDIGLLPMSNWQLGSNSFLAHGHFNYKHLMLGRIQMGRKEERYVVGVPGIYNNKEKYLAGLFGFSIFIPARSTQVLTGCFGYWIVEVKA